MLRAPRVLRKAGRSLEARLVGSFLVISSSVLIVVAATAFTAARLSLRGEITQGLTNLSALKEAELNRWVESQARRLELVATLPGVRRGGDPWSNGVSRFNEVSMVTRGSGADLAEVFFLSLQGGRVTASTEPGHVGTYHTNDLFFLEGRSRTFIGDVYPDPMTGAPTLTVATPIRDTMGVVHSLVAAHLNLEQMDRILEDPAGARVTNEAYLVTSTNDFVSSQHFGRPEFSRGVHTDGINAALRGETGVDLYANYDGVPVIGAYRWIPERNLALLVEATQDQAFAPARELLRLILGVGFAATLLLMLGIAWMAGRVARPIVAVSEAAARVAAGDFDVSVPAQRTDEVGTLARSFNTMTERLRAVYHDLHGQIEVSNRTLSALAESKHLIQSIVDNSNALIAVAAPDGELSVANRALERVLGVESGGAVGHTLSDLLPEEVAQEFSEAKRTALRDGRLVEREIRLTDEDGHRTYLCSWFPLGDNVDTPNSLGMIATDLTDRERAEEDRAHFEAQFRHSQKLESLGVLAGGIAHDFNNILAAILGHAELAREEAQTPGAAESLLQVVKAAHRGAELTNQMLAYAGRASFRVETMDLNEAVATISDLVAVSLPKTVTLHTDLSPEPLPVQADPSQISQVLMNLVANAGQSIGSDPGTVWIQTESARMGTGRIARLVVRDTGCGMDPATRERIFDPFFTTKETGHGLGLAAVAGIVSGLGGNIVVDSKVGRGTTFKVELPLSRRPSAQKASIETSTAAPSPTFDGTLLVVDDEAPVRTLIRRVLERAGFNVLEAVDGPSGMEAFLQNRQEIQGVVLDLSMPGMGGEDVFQEIRKAGHDTPVLITSGYDPAHATQSLQSAEGVSFLQKPFRPVQLTEAVIALLGHARSKPGAS